MKTLPLIGVISLLAAPLAAQAQTVIFNDTFVTGGSSLNGTSTPGGTPSASTTSYDVASTKADTTGPTIGSGKLHLALNGGTTAGYTEVQAIFAGTPVQLVNVGDSINMTLVFTNSAGTLLAGGPKSVIDVGLFNSGGSAPLAGLLNNSGLGSATTYITGGCTNWQGYVASINYLTNSSLVYTRPVQNGASPNNGVQDLLFSGAGTGLYKFPSGTQIGSTLLSQVTLTSGATYTLSFNLMLSAAGTITVVNNLYTGPDTTGTLLSAQTNTTAGGNTYTNFANQYDGLAIGLANSGTSLNPQMDISKITITKNSYSSPTITGLNNQTVIAGANPTLSPTVTGNPRPGLQWYVSTDGGVTSNALSYATSSLLTLTNVQYSQNNYIYTLVAANSQGTNASNMTLSVIVTPSITGLFNQAVYPGSTVNINPSVSGVPAPALQWLTNGVPVADGLDANGSTITGSTTSTLQIENAQIADTGTYSLVASNSAGIVTNSMYLLVSATDVLPTLVGPTNITVIQGNNGIFAISAYYGLPQPTLQWLDQTGTTIVDATNISLTLSNVQYSQNGYVYSLVASNSVGSVTNSATLTVLVPPAITTQPTNLVVTNTQSASFAVVATGVPALAYQWSKNGVPISPAVNNTSTNATFTIASAAPGDMASYSCTITNQAGTTNTASVTLTVNSTMSAVAFTPTNSQPGVCYDTPLYVTFSSAPTLRANGTIKIFNVTNSATPVDTLNMSLNVTPYPGLAFAQPRLIGGDTFTNYPVIITGTTAAIYPHSGVMTSNQTYYVTIDDGVFADASGAYFAGISATNVWQFTTKVGGPANPTNLVVAADDSGDFLTVQGAVDSVPANNTTPTIINIRNGTYIGIVDVKSKNNLDFRGQSRNGAIVSYPNNNNLNGTGAPLRAMFVLNGNNCTFENLTLTNTTPSGGSQAEAVDVEGSQAIFYNMELDSYQDTFLVHSAGKLVYFQDCLIQGQTDFNWGYGTVYYTNCEVRCLLSGGHVTQPRSPYTTNGFGFINCRITQGYSGSATFDLGRTIGTPSSPSEVLYYQCLMADVVTGYSSDAGTNMADYDCSNLTATAYKTLAYSTHSPSNDPFVIAIQTATNWLYGWQPQVAPNIISQPGGQIVSQGQSAIFTVSATGILTPTYQWLKNGSPISGATNATLTISNTKRSDAASYSVVVSNGAGSVTSAAATLTYTGNAAPAVANIVTNYVASGMMWKIALADLATAAGWSDADGDAVTLSSVTSPSADGTNVTSDSAFIYYQGTVTAEDSFTYTVTDPYAATATGTIYLEPAAVVGSIQNTPALVSGHPTFSGSGVPNYTYGVESAGDLNGPWINAGTVTAAANNGSWSFTDTNQTDPGTIFYRLYYPYSADNPPQ